MKVWKGTHVCTGEILDRLRARDPDAQHAFWREYWPDLRALCLRTGGEASADEIVAEVLSEFLFRYVDRLEHPGAVWSYLRLMTVRRAAHAAEAAQRPEVDLDTLTGLGLDPEEAAHVKHLLPRLAHCLGKLRPKARRILELRFGSGLTNPEIGALLGDSKQYVGRVLQSSLAALRKCLLAVRGGGTSTPDDKERT